MKDREGGGVTGKITVWFDYIKHVLLCLLGDFLFSSFFPPNCLSDHHIHFLTQMNVGNIFYLLRKVAAVGGNYGSKSNVH